MTRTELRTIPALPLALALAALMAITRYKHGGAPGLLPDASLAVFLLGGFYLARLRWFAFFLGVAALADQAAIRWGAVSEWCLTPAYAFLVPAYGAAWLAGWWVARAPLRGARAAGRVALAFAAGTASWFAISNAGFYLFSGYFADIPAGEYAARVLEYFPPYAAAAAFYVGLAAALHALFAFARARRALA
jgi:hypothetical protein